MRALITTDAIGGVWQYSLDLARGLALRGAETILALLGPAPDAGQQAEAGAIHDLMLVETGLPLDWLCSGPAPVRAAAAALAELARTSRADLVHLNTPALAAVNFAGVPIVAVAHGCLSTWWEAAKGGAALDPSYAWHLQLMREGLHAADEVVAPSASFAAVVARHYGLPCLPHVVHNGRTPLVSSCTQPDDRVLTVGRLWDPAKGAGLLDKVAARLDVPFNAAGATTGPHGERVDLQYLNTLGHLDGAALSRHLASQPVFVSAASFEPFGLAVLEAASAGCALVLSDIATFRELWSGAALFVPAQDDAIYAAAIETVIGNSDLRRRLGEEARIRARRYSPQAMTDAMFALYSNLLGRSVSGGRVAA